MGELFDKVDVTRRQFVQRLAGGVFTAASLLSFPRSAHAQVPPTPTSSTSNAPPGFPTPTPTVSVSTFPTPTPTPTMSASSEPTPTPTPTMSPSNEPTP